MLKPGKDIGIVDETTITPIETKVQTTVRKLINIINRSKLTPQELIKILAELLYSVGASIEERKNLTSTQVMSEYLEKNSLGTTLMAQALFMKEHWKLDKETK